MSTLAPFGRIGPLLAFGLWSACAVPPPPNGPVEHQHRVTTTVSIGSRGIAPRPDMRIPVLSTLVWRNLGDVPLTVEIELTTCGKCETVLGFTPVPNGAKSLPIAPGAVATICFHQVGTFPYTVQLGDAQLHGTVAVLEEP